MDVDEGRLYGGRTLRQWQQGRNQTKPPAKITQI